MICFFWLLVSCFKQQIKSWCVMFYFLPPVVPLTLCWFVCISVCACSPGPRVSFVFLLCSPWLLIRLQFCISRYFFPLTLPCLPFCCLLFGFWTSAHQSSSLFIMSSCLPLCLPPLMRTSAGHIR